MKTLMHDTGDLFRLPRWNRIPDVGLYMDQLITFINSSFEPFAEKMGLKPITKNMINNYVKARIVEAPVNKLYFRPSVAMVVVVYLVKSCYSTEEAGKLIRLGLSVKDVELSYNGFCDAIELAVRGIFAGADEPACAGSIEQKKYIMEHFVLSLACKYYVNAGFLSDSESYLDEQRGESDKDEHNS